MQLKVFNGHAGVDPTLGTRQIRVVANSGQSDRVGDVLVASGCKLDNYLKNLLFWQTTTPLCRSVISRRPLSAMSCRA